MAFDINQVVPLGPGEAERVLVQRKLWQSTGQPLRLPPSVRVPIRDILAVVDAARYAGGNAAPQSPVKISQEDFEDILFVYVPAAANANVTWL